MYVTHPHSWPVSIRRRGLNHVATRSFGKRGDYWVSVTLHPSAPWIYIANEITDAGGGLSPGEAHKMATLLYQAFDICIAILNGTYRPPAVTVVPRTIRASPKSKKVTLVSAENRAAWASALNREARIVPHGLIAKITGIGTGTDEHGERVPIYRRSDGSGSDLDARMGPRG